MNQTVSSGFFIVSTIAGAICLIAIIVTLICCIVQKPKKFRLSALITGIVFGIILIAGGAITAVNFSMEYGWNIPDHFEYETYYIEDTEITDIDINGKFANVEIRSGDALHYTIPTNFGVSAEIDGNKLTINQKRQSYFFNAAISYAPDIILYIPNDMTSCSILCATDAGCVTARDLTVSCANFLSDLGAITVENITTSSGLSVSADMGALHIANCRSETGELLVYNSMGETTLDNLVFDYIKAKSDMGDMQLNYIEARKIELDLDMGSVSGTIAGQRNEYTISVDCDLGDSNLYDQRGTTDKILNAEVDMGSIDIRFVTPKNS